MTKVSCTKNLNPCIKRITNTLSTSKLIVLLEKLIQNPFQESIEILTNLTNENFWKTHKTQIIITVIIVLLTIAVGLVVANFCRVVRCWTQYCFPASVRHGAGEHELEPFNRTGANSHNNSEQPATPEPMSFPLSEVQGLNTPLPDKKTAQPAANSSGNSVNTDSRSGGPPPYSLS